MQSIYGNSLQMLTKSLDYLWVKSEITNHNIANAETPGYKAQYVTFEEEFRNQLEQAIYSNNSQSVTNAINQSTALVHSSTSEGLRTDENNVNLDVEMVELSRTTLQYQTTIDLINSDFSRLRTVIKGQ